MDPQVQRVPHEVQGKWGFGENPNKGGNRKTERQKYTKKERKNDRRQRDREAKDREAKDREAKDRETETER